MPRAKTDPHARRCSFCKRLESQVARLIAGQPGVFICDDCVDACRDLLAEPEPMTEFPAPLSFDARPGLPPRDIFARLNEYVVGQEQAKRVLAVAVYNHYKRIAHHPRPGDPDLEKSNILLIGPTGCGKTLLAQTLARILDVPFCIADATALTEAGYVGEDVESILSRLLQAADFNLGRAEKGIVYVDEVDKIARKSGGNPSITRDVSGEGVQQALLKLIEGARVNITSHGGRKHPQQEFVTLDTRDVLFICGGTFIGLDEQRAARQAASPGEAPAGASPDDLMHYGLIPEFVGRLPVVVNLAPLDHQALMAVLTQPRNALVKQYRRLLEMDEVELVFEPEALHLAADLALRQETGARGLRAILEQTLLDVMYVVPSRSDVRRVVVDVPAIRGQAHPRLLGAGDQVLAWGPDEAARPSLRRAA